MSQLHSSSKSPDADEISVKSSIAFDRGMRDEAFPEARQEEEEGPFAYLPLTVCTCHSSDPRDHEHRYGVYTRLSLFSLPW